MSSKNFKNVWGKCNRHTGSSFGTYNQKSISEANDLQIFGKKQGWLSSPFDSFDCRYLAFGAFGSRIDLGKGSGATSLPTFGSTEKCSSFFSFELGNSSSGSSAPFSRPSSGPNSLLSFYMEPKRYDLGPHGFARTDPPVVKNSSKEARNSIDWGLAVENVFKEEIGKTTGWSTF